MVKFDHISKIYPGQWKNALTDINLEIKDGEFFCLVGPSGCGKSTLLKLIANIEPPTSGEIEKPEEVSMVFQSGALLPWINVEENTAFPLKMTGTNQAERAKKVIEVLKIVELTDFRKKYPRELSGGQKQRVGIARALTTNPKVLLLDEPFSALDALTTEELHKDLLRIWQDSGKTIVMVSHLISEAVVLADRIGVMKEGRLVSIVEIKLSRHRSEHDNEVLRRVAFIRKMLE